MLLQVHVSYHIALFCMSCPCITWCIALDLFHIISNSITDYLVISPDSHDHIVSQFASNTVNRFAF